MFSPFVLALAMNVFFGTTSGECEITYSLMESETWFLLDDSGIDDESVRGSERVPVAEMK